MKIIYIVLILIISITGGFIGSYFRSIQNIEQNTSLEAKIIDISKKSSESTVSIIIKNDLTLYENNISNSLDIQGETIEKNISQASGFIIRNDGIILTNKHILPENYDKITVITNDKKEFDAKLIYVDKNYDLALLKIEANNLKVLNFIENKENIEIGSFVIAIGNPYSDFKNSISFGIISGKNRKIKEQNLENLLQTDINIAKGNSGGPLLNTSGQVIGINTAISNLDLKIAFAIPLDKKNISELLNNIK